MKLKHSWATDTRRTGTPRLFCLVKNKTNSFQEVIIGVRNGLVIKILKLKILGESIQGKIILHWKIK